MSDANPEEQKPFGFKSLKARILVYAALPVTVAMILIIGTLIWQLFHDMREGTLEKLRLELAFAANEIEKHNLEVVTVPKIMALAQENGMFGKRLESIAYARRILEIYPQLTGAYFGYEPNADNQDEEFLNRNSPELASAGDAAGRFLPYWFRDQADAKIIKLTPLVDMETSFYYQGVKNRATGVSETNGIFILNGISKHYQPNGEPVQREIDPNLMVTEPYDYEGKLIVEQTYPIVVDGRFAGIAGVDRALDDIDRFLTELKPFRTAGFILLSRRGRIISATMDKSLATKRIEETRFADVLLPFYNLKANETRPHQLVRDTEDDADYFYEATRLGVGDWTIAMRVAENEVFAPVWATLRRTVLLAGAGLLIVLFSLNWLANTVSRRVSIAAGLAGRVAEGDLTAKVPRGGSDETGVLLGAVSKMIKSLNGLIGQVKKSSIQLISTATQITATAKSQERIVGEFGSSTNQIAAAVKEISATSQELARTMGEVANRVNGAATLANSGRKSLGGMESTMRGLADATGSISAKLSIISDKAKNINSVVTTITKVADQTNLLSLNAAIEAEKAGEYGLGFSVVAREIRRLADQTAVATLDIDQMVQEMQSSVSAGVMEMDRFTDQVGRGVQSACELSGQLGLIIEQVQELTPRFEAVNHGMMTQSEGAQQISEAMLQMTEVAHTISNSVQEFNKASANLHQAVGGLREEVSRFKVED
jgi:methyl-accepting chemotaxis protein